MASYFTKNRKKTLDSGFDILTQTNLSYIYFYYFGDRGSTVHTHMSENRSQGKFSSATMQVRNTVEVLWLGGKCPNWLHNSNNQYLGLSMFHCALTLLRIVFHQPFNFNFDLGSLSLWLSPPEMFSDILCDKSHHSNLDSTCYLWLSSGHHT